MTRIAAVATPRPPGLEQTIEHWRLVASTPERRAGLAAACAQQEKATRAAMSRYDCDW